MALGSWHTIQAAAQGAFQSGVSIKATSSTNGPTWATIPDWALVWEDTDPFDDPGEKLYLVRETKSSTDQKDLRETEKQKIPCGPRHFNGALQTDFKLIEKAAGLPGGTRV